ncbi:twin-arginine translocation signal domain-containing protein [Halorussus salilacus]|uniref:twin-arginine translocation signal domain-containing protein n=1 Tax=Halorussus salilacus TaxID=2953750 RepID=UPI0020A1641D|nr:twin-arginine translocation signal domain-containing protein [Halorussus salilacus]USZ69583.1 twin-arginine translocation signal domain-containing protein [Halorussus salilacus]
MTRDNDTRQRLVDDETRRSFLKKSAVATVGASALGTGVGAAQDLDLDDNWKALIFVDNFHPQARFTFVSDVVEWTPNYGDVNDSWFSDYNTRMIRWLNTDETVPLFVAEDAEIGEYDGDLGFVTDADDDSDQPQLFEMEREWTPFGDNPRLTEVEASPVPEDEEDQILENEDWWQTGGGDGTTANETATNETAANASAPSVTDDPF